MVRSLRSSKLQKKHRRQLILKISLVLIGVTILIAGPAFLTHASFLSVRDVTVIGNSVVPTSDVQKIVTESLRGNYLKVFSRSNIALYPKDEIITRLKGSFSRFESVAISRASLHALSVHVVERKQKALWCQTLERSNCYFIDDHGYIFDRAIEFPEGIYFVYTGLIEGDPITKQFLPDADFIKAQTLINGLTMLGLKSRSFAYLADASFEIGLEGGEKVLVSLQDDPQKVLSNLESVLRDPSLHIIKDGELTVASLDARYGNKVVIKKKQI